MRTVNLYNFFTKKVEKRQVVSGTDEVLNGHLPYLPIEDNIANEISGDLALYEKEKTLYAFAHFIVGKLGKNRVCAPLFFIPAKIKKEKYNYLELNLDQKFLNVNFLNVIGGTHSAAMIESLKDLLTRREIDFETSTKIQEVFEEYCDHIDAEEVLLYPELLSSNKIKTTRPKSGYKVVSAMGYGLVANSDKTLGVLTELSELGETEELSEALKSILSGKNEVVDFHREGRLPTILSEAQKRSIHNSGTYASSMVIGPPGTGKSFTIANMAIDYLQKGDAMLVVSKTDEAVEVIYQKIKELGFDNMVIRAGSVWQNRSLMNYVDQLLTFPPNYTKSKGLESLNDELIHMDKELTRTGGNFEEAIQKELEYGRYLFDNRSRKNIISRIKKSYISWKNKQNIPHWHFAREFYQQRAVYLEKADKFVHAAYDRRLNTFLVRERRHLMNFGKALRAYSVKKRENLFEDVNFESLLGAFPIWLCTSSNIFEVLPLQANLFDLVVVDEATQCDLASVIPSIQRGRRLSIVGDPNQLRHFSFLSTKDQKELKERFNVRERHEHLTNYRDDSILDICFNQNTLGESITFLNEHYRGSRQLIDFSNQEFYNNQLKIMKSLPHHSVNAVSVVKCEGTRERSGENLEEAEELIQTIIGLIGGKEAENVSIGVISPFRKQVELIRRLVDKKLEAREIIKHNIKIGTPYAFQGSERDYMLISWGVDAKGFRTVSAFLNKREAFNVAITRARSKMTHFVSFGENELPAESLLGKYMRSLKLGQEEKDINAAGDAFLNEVSQALTQFKYKFEVDYTIASTPVDILVKTVNGYKAIDLIGFPGKFYSSIELNQYLLLGRAKVPVFPLAYSYWYFDKERCLVQLKAFLRTE